MKEMQMKAIDIPYSYSGKQGLSISTYGNVVSEVCPVCDSRNHDSIWHIPMTTLEKPLSLFGGYLAHAPTLKTPFVLYCFSLCSDCESIFLNPQTPREQIINTYKNSSQYIKYMEDEKNWGGYKERYSLMMKYVSADYEILLDAACGWGQIAYLAKNDSQHKWNHCIGLDLSAPYVNNMNSMGIEAHQFDIDFDNIESFVKPNSVDFISYFEAFEHVYRPVETLKKLFITLKVGGRIFFSAQRYGENALLSIRPGEPIYIGSVFIEKLHQWLQCKIVEVIESGPRYLIILEKTE